MPFGWFKKSSKFDVNTNFGRENFFVITAIFNPCSFQSRYSLYHDFARHMEEAGAQLITVECIFPSLDQHDFRVTDSNNPNHIQLKSKSVFWMKENLINIAVSRLPPHAKYVCWLDADITFKEKNWVDLTIKELTKYTVVQVFKKAKFLGPVPDQKVLRTDYSFGYSVVHGKPIDQNRYDEWYPHSGYGWAMDITAFRNVEGLPDYDIVGSGDLHFAFSLIDRVTNALEDRLSPWFKKFVLTRSEQTFQAVKDISTAQNKGMVGYVPMSVSHHWHGSRADRQYVNRWKILIANQFNLETDMTRNSDGLLQFNEKETMQFLQRDILQHFTLRKEDEKTLTDADRNLGRNKITAPPPPNYLKSESSSRNKDDRRRLKDDHFVTETACPYPEFEEEVANHGICPPCPAHPQPCHPAGDDGHHHHHGNQGCHGGNGDYINDYSGSVICSSNY